MLIMTALPVFSIAAPALHQNMTHASPVTTALDKIQAVTATAHDCCQTLELSCDCDNGQSSYSAIHSLTNIATTHSRTVFKNSLITTLSYFRSDSLYRPPIAVI